MTNTRIKTTNWNTVRVRDIYANEQSQKLQNRELPEYSSLTRTDEYTCINILKINKETEKA